MLKDLKLPTDAPGKSWGVPMAGDVIMTHDESKTNVYFTIHTIKTPLREHSIRLQKFLSWPLIIDK